MSSRKTKNAGIIVMHRMYQNERRKLPLLLAIMDMTNGPTQELPLSVNSKKLKNSLSLCGGINSQNNVREKDWMAPKFKPNQMARKYASQLFRKPMESKT